MVVIHQYTKITSTVAHNLASSSNILHTWNSSLKLLLMLELIDTTHTQVCDDNVGCNEVKT